MVFESMICELGVFLWIYDCFLILFVIKVNWHYRLPIHLPLGQMVFPFCLDRLFFFPVRRNLLLGDAYAISLVNYWPKLDYIWKGSTQYFSPLYVEFLSSYNCYRVLFYLYLILSPPLFLIILITYIFIYFLVHHFI